MGATRLSAARSLRAPGAIRAGAPRPARGGSTSWPLAPAGPRPAVVLVRARCDGRARLAAGVRGFLLLRVESRRPPRACPYRWTLPALSRFRAAWVPSARARLRRQTGGSRPSCGRRWAGLGGAHRARGPHAAAEPAMRLGRLDRVLVSAPRGGAARASAATEPASQSRDEPPPSSRS